MKWVVLDASAIAAWVFPGQTTLASRRFLADLDRHRLAAPYVFRWEVANLIMVKGAVRDVEPATALRAIDALEIAIAEPTPQQDVFALTSFAMEAGLTLFDAAYLALAMELAAALATRDARLIDAARIAGVDVFDLRD
ncbi:MAG: type II toxin-antitoxin system VapC family toxin [Alphaproteobacteria bacterium]|nr:type II toxin-antitoxin system VapC family toxin [Alphaproteobacteria bacterium]MBU1525743.1 type II toxin-antitoxin system VapC family toxin [Alphaproteobacteria bacterium]MBU2118400.1 type II toxin-antitoxin system VapC family toxin [Alphaproteobacteria bacterium]MBU2351876.1 type II toxin-antitoxin system VapC family toxin [Alphaproteobacteria bacterium]MBU2382730.1 type II toxin-antitoxin system VapC family toxin [Alphaproteobacteria bacterium]